MDLSYAQHLEDFCLSRVFGDRTDGFYIDVGAGHPVADNASCWFYLRGWRGIVVEPNPALLALYECIRPRDLRENRPLAREAGVVEFHEVERLHGFSTIVGKFAESARSFGVDYQTRCVEATTLATLCAANNVGAIDFLKIDVEGAEGEVLAGGNWTRWRPKVVVCEAVAPGTMAANWADWEPLLLAHGYEFVFFDDLNRWYVARENADILARFPREKPDWLVVPHLGHTNRAPFRDDHPDHAFARDLVGALLARAPRLPRDMIVDLVLAIVGGDPDAPVDGAGRASILARVFPAEPFAEARPDIATPASPTRRNFVERMVDTDAFRVLLGRLAMSWDGGQILD
jgi:FkbM family methyltransferase